MERWWACAFNCTAWAPTTGEWDALLAGVPEEAERTRIARYRVEADRKRALAGRVLLRRVASEALGGPVELARTERGKPFVKAPAPGLFNLNLSHHGSWVVVCAHSARAVGVDVMEYEHPKGCRRVADFFATMAGSFTAAEWLAIRAGAPEPGDAHLRTFYQLWSLKESYIKALGVGIGFGLQRASFELLADPREERQEPSFARAARPVLDGRPVAEPRDEPRRARAARLVLDGRPDASFEFSLQELDAAHCVGVALQALEGRPAVLPFTWTVLSDLVHSPLQSGPAALPLDAHGAA